MRLGAVCGVPVTDMMPDTAWIELVEAGWNVLVDAEKDRIVKEALADEKKSEGKPELIYGGGHAGQKIAEILAQQA